MLINIYEIMWLLTWLLLLPLPCHDAAHFPFCILFCGKLVWESFSVFCLFQEKKLRDEIEQLKKDIREQDAYIKGRRDEAAKLESLILGYRQSYSQFKLERDKLHDERKYECHLSQFGWIFLFVWSLINLPICRSLWGRESELSSEIDRLKSEVVKAEKSLDHATPGVSAYLLMFYGFFFIISSN